MILTEKVEMFDEERSYYKIIYIKSQSYELNRQSDTEKLSDTYSLILSLLLI